MFVTKCDRWESTSQVRVMCEHYYLSVLMYTPVMFDFTTEDRYWIEQENLLRFLFIEKENAFAFPLFLKKNFCQFGLTVNAVNLVTF